MLYLPNDELFVNRFVHCEVPTKAQIFSRTGQKAVTPSGTYTGDESYRFNQKPTESADEFLKAVESYEFPTKVE